MAFRLASEPAKPDRPNEDFAALGVHSAVLLDGAGTPPDATSGCIHGVAWYARTLGGLLLAEMTGASDLPGALAASIDHVCALHADTCDLKHSDTPSATVVAVRRNGPNLDYLVLADSVLVLDHGDPPEVITDDREAGAGRALRTRMDALPTGSTDHAQAHRDYVARLADHRNQPGGFWVASTDPGAADEAITGSAPLAGLSAVTLLSDGASRLPDRFHLASWRDTLDLLRDDGPSELIRRVRHAEHSDPDGQRWPRAKTCDDATVIYGDLRN